MIYFTKQDDGTNSFLVEEKKSSAPWRRASPPAADGRHAPQLGSFSLCVVYILIDTRRGPASILIVNIPHRQWCPGRDLFVIGQDSMSADAAGPSRVPRPSLSSFWCCYTNPLEGDETKRACHECIIKRPAIFKKKVQGSGRRRIHLLLRQWHLFFFSVSFVWSTPHVPSMFSHRCRLLLQLCDVTITMSNTVTIKKEIIPPDDERAAAAAAGSSFNGSRWWWWTGGPILLGTRQVQRAS